MSWAQNPDNGLRVVKTFNGINFDIQYKPSQYLSIENGNTSANPIKQISLKISLENGKDLVSLGAGNHAEAQQSLYYFSFLFQNDIYLVKDGKTIPCSLYHFEKSIDSKNYRTFHLMFDDPDTNEAEEFVLAIDSERLSSLPVRLKIGNPNIPKVSGL